MLTAWQGNVHHPARQHTRGFCLDQIGSAMKAQAVAVSAELTFEQYGNEAVIQLLTNAVDDMQAMDTARLSDNVSPWNVPARISTN